MNNTLGLTSFHHRLSWKKVLCIPNATWLFFLPQRKHFVTCFNPQRKVMQAQATPFLFQHLICSAASSTQLSPALAETLRPADAKKANWQRKYGNITAEAALAAQTQIWYGDASGRKASSVYQHFHKPVLHIQNGKTMY
ncbi:hypothetical protein MPER_06006, partial [Moniliophthora perniciosa FA553]